MTLAQRFVTHTVETAPVGSRPALEHARRRFGHVPTPLALIAESPLLIEAFGSLTAVFDRSSLTQLEREVVIMTVARHNECHYCVAMHSRMLTMHRADAALVEALRAGTPLPQPRLEALAAFARALLVGRGDPTEQERQAFTEAGFSPEQALDIIVGIGAYTLSTLANRLTQTPLDPALEPFRWQGSGQGR